MNEEVFLKKLREALEMKEGESLTMKTTLQEVPTWDSIGHLRVATLLDVEFGVVSLLEQVAKCATVTEIYRMAKKQ